MIFGCSQIHWEGWKDRPEIDRKTEGCIYSESENCSVVSDFLQPHGL